MSTSSTSSELVQSAAQALYQKKGMNILAIDLRGLSTMADFFLIAEGTVDRHVQALCFEVIHQLQPLRGKPNQIEGEQSGDWIAMDYGDLVIHLFTPSMRRHYQLEQLWSLGKLVQLSFEESSS